MKRIRLVDGSEAQIDDNVSTADYQRFEDRFATDSLSGQLDALHQLWAAKPVPPFPLEVTMLGISVEDEGDSVKLAFRDLAVIAELHYALGRIMKSHE